MVICDICHWYTVKSEINIVILFLNNSQFETFSCLSSILVLFFIYKLDIIIIILNRKDLLIFI